MLRSIGLNAVVFFLLGSTVNAQQGGGGVSWKLPEPDFFGDYDGWEPSDTAWWMQNNPTTYDLSPTNAAPVGNLTSNGTGTTYGHWHAPGAALATVRLKSTFKFPYPGGNPEFTPQEAKILYEHNPPPNKGSAPSIGARLIDVHILSTGGGNRDGMVPLPDAAGPGTTYSPCQTFWAVNGSERTRTLTCEYQPKVAQPGGSWIWGGLHDVEISNYHFAEESREQFKVDAVDNPNLQGGVQTCN